ncbi:putative flavonoid 3'-monooxygenase [Rosa chinensis]|uniref:Putative flavonoid 3'-monooxygenase n=1 Tax=Rosa chinensis TaxID=74649 RepID=A0A2P6P3K7_ROSCH|nr:cytochrome P450 CYP736A12 [Rosa chinensis]PRQ16517.1 putative flavonoid 3'-monooxygenase [Rosa chinensis]
MSPSTIIAILLVLLTCLWSLISASSKSKHKKLPPGPRSLPIIGNLHMLGNLPHRSLQGLAKKYGHIMSIRLGSVLTIVVSSPKAAELFLKTHDTNFASRPKIQASEYISYGTKGMAFSEYGPYWRHVRKLCTLQLFCPAKIEVFAPLRKDELGVLLRKLKKAAEEGGVVDVSGHIGVMNEDITYRMVLGCKRDDRFDLKAIVEETFFLAGAFNISDFVPSLTALDIQGLTKRMKKVSKTIDQLLEKIIDDHEQVAKTTSGKQGKHEDFVDVLLSLMNQPLNPNDEQVHFLDRTNVKAILLDMLTAASDTSASSIVWSLSELLRHPRVMKKLQKELQTVVGMDRMVEETDLPKLDYLSMVVKESFRLHPVGPLLIPHESIEDIAIDGYDIPKKSRIIVNIWSIGRDPSVWSENVEEFYPERFMNNNIDLRGHDFQLIPFGSGRRGCPGLQLGLTTVRIVLAQLVHCFNWELPTGMLPQDLDMSEKFGLSMSKAKHLLAKPTYRLL